MCCDKLTAGLCYKSNRRRASERNNDVTHICYSTESANTLSGEEERRREERRRGGEERRIYTIMVLLCASHSHILLYS